MADKSLGGKVEGSQALMRGLEVLRLIAESPAPLSSAEVARRVGLHQSWVSRILKTLIAAGYIKKPSYHSFGADYGILCLGGIASKQFAFTTRPLAALTRQIAAFDGFEFALGCLWDGQIIYFLRTHSSLGVSPPAAGRFPLHQSSIALRILLDLPEREALKALEESKRRYGWDRGNGEPATPAACLRKARSGLADDCLFVERRDGSGMGASILINIAGEPLAALALTGTGTLSRERVALALHEGRRQVELSMSKKDNS